MEGEQTGAEEERQTMGKWREKGEERVEKIRNVCEIEMW